MTTKRKKDLRKGNRKKYLMKGHGYAPGDITPDNRAVILHPTKGWRTRAITPFSIDESKLHPLVRKLRQAARRKGIAV